MKKLLLSVTCLLVLLFNSNCYAACTVLTTQNSIYLQAQAKGFNSGSHNTDYNQCGGDALNNVKISTYTPESLNKVNLSTGLNVDADGQLNVTVSNVQSSPTSWVINLYSYHKDNSLNGQRSYTCTEKHVCILDGPCGQQIQCQ